MNSCISYVTNCMLCGNYLVAELKCANEKSDLMVTCYADDINK
jgi:hypothetical protein